MMHGPMNFEDGGQCLWKVSFMDWPLHPDGQNHGTHWIRGWVDSRVSLDVFENVTI